jgi:hypothetical protein
MSTRPFALSIALATATTLAPAATAGELKFERVVIDDRFPGAYQVEVADVNGDGKPDVVAVGGGTCAWFENPSWTKRVITGPKQTPGIISSATRDLDGDGKAEVAIAYEFAMNEPKKGKLLLAKQGKTADDPWAVEPIADVPSIHRLRWGFVVGELVVTPGSVTRRKRDELVVAPIFGPSAKPPLFNQEPAHVVVFERRTDSLLGAEGLAVGGVVLKARVSDRGPRWSLAHIGDAPVTHAIDVVDIDGDGHHEVLAASNLGVTRFDVVGVTGGLALFQPETLAAGAPGEAPKRGSSEVHVGRLKDGRRYLATVEPWHGTEVAVYLSESLKPLRFGPRTVIDSSLKDGHALWVADVDGDGDDELFAGYRGAGTSVLAFDFNGKTWDRTVVDDKIAAQDLRGGDLDGDGTPDVVAVGGSTRNVVWYRPKK